MIRNSQICLGTAQFGLDYGATNRTGKIGIDEIRKIIKLAATSNIRFIDTAQAYGSAETVVGKY